VDEAKRTLASSGGGIRSGRVTFDVKIEAASTVQRYYSVGVVTPSVRIEGCYIGHDSQARPARPLCTFGQDVASVL